MKTKLLLVILFLLTFIFGPSKIVLAAGYSYSIESTMRLSTQEVTTVETVISASSAETSDVPASITIAKYGSGIAGLVATDGDGAKIPVVEEDSGLVVRLNTLQGSSPGNWSATVSYNTQLGLAIGRSFITMISPHSYGELSVVAEKVTLLTDAELGSFVIRGAEPTSSSTASGQSSNTWQNDKGPLSDSFGLLFGDSALAKVVIQKTLENNTLWWQTQSIVLPPDTNQQQVFIESVRPAPTSIRLDLDGNIILDYRIAPRQKVDVVGDLRIALRSYTYLLDTSLLVNDIDPALVERYTPLNQIWADTPLEIVDRASTPVNQLIEKIYDQIAVKYASPSANPGFDSAEARANALIGELRANGLPARLVIGAVFGDGSGLNAVPVSHAWAEVFVPEVGWVTVDPSFEQNGDYFGVADVQRVGLALRGFDPEFPPENLTDFSIEFLDQDLPAAPVMKPSITSTKYMILPGLAINSTSIQMPKGVIVDDVGLTVGDGEPMPLGSLAPLQSLNIRSLSLLAAAFSGEAVEYGMLAGGVGSLDAAVIAQATATVNYLPMLLLVGVSLLVFGLKTAFARRHERPKTPAVEAVSEPKERPVRDEKPIKRDNSIEPNDTDEDVENINMLDGFVRSDQPAENIEDKKPEPVSEDGRPTTKTTISPRPPRSDETPIPHQPVRSTASVKVERPMELRRAHQATSDEISREIKRKRPPLIQ